MNVVSSEQTASSCHTCHTSWTHTKHTNLQLTVEIRLDGKLRVSVTSDCKDRTQSGRLLIWDSPVRCRKNRISCKCLLIHSWNIHMDIHINIITITHNNIIIFVILGWWSISFCVVLYTPVSPTFMTSHLVYPQFCKETQSKIRESKCCKFNPQSQDMMAQCAVCDGLCLLQALYHTHRDLLTLEGLFYSKEAPYPLAFQKDPPFSRVCQEGLNFILCTTLCLQTDTIKHIH